ncbi:hypothetical protein GGS23DRAFT_604872 [Durotheca rogersii]|uniref:uncharacterized protein n=1 Tax=Durotheca rogersii TaxID=419775 RepID=UPI0022211247|nr:uncharacterized protein GGS23DRAFT_604872 [Durotheca rogersii]KAI5863937.1 hypothetical protein GGS23DRAFT_604872 [Durotheca rogersii]
MPRRATIPSPIREALIECFRAITRLVRPDRRRQLKTEDVDVAAPPGPIIDILEAIAAGAPSFSLETDGKISFDAPQGFKVRVDLLEIGGELGCVERIHATEPFYEGSVASRSDLLRLRAMTVVDRGGDGDVLDFLWLLEVVKAGQHLPELDSQELECVIGAAEACLPGLGQLAAVAVLGERDSAAALQL